MVWLYDVTTMISKSATALPIGMSVFSPSARLDPPTATTNRISSVAYAVDESASEENTASAMVFGSRCSSILVLARGRPTRSRFTTSNIVPLLPPCFFRQARLLAGTSQREGYTELVRQRNCHHP